MVLRTNKKVKSALSPNPLSRYQSMRDFGVTEEPRGAARKPKSQPRDGLPFVIQKHAATRLHYDFRLGWDGVLKSWAVTKGPSYNPADKRLAVQVEDHPWEYRDFEGIIPKGQYGGGTVMVWDKGVWIPHGDVEQGLKDGRLKFELHGKKLVGDWALVRMHGRNDRPDKPNWLLIKEKDEFARDDSSAQITDEAPDSAASGRSMEQITARKDRVWNSKDSSSNAEQSTAEAKKSQQKKIQKSSVRKPLAGVKKLPKEKFPGFISPHLAQTSTAAPSGEGWIHELKLDGYRIQIQVQSDERPGRGIRRVKLLTRKGLDWSARMPDIAAAAQQLPVASAILDGEAVVLDGRGVSNFSDLQAAFQGDRRSYITYYAFDLLHLDGHNLRALPLTKRRSLLEKLLIGAEGAPLKMSESIEGKGAVVFEKACALGAEGIVSKLATSKYASGRSGTWLKIKCHLEQEFVVGGFTLPSNGTVGVGSLLLGYYQAGKLLYAGRTGTGFTQSTHRTLRARLDELASKQSPFIDLPRDMQRDAHWVKPQLVAQVAFSTWTRGNLVRQAAFKGLREDKPAHEVTRETAILQEGREFTKAARQSSYDLPRKGKAVMRDSELTHPEKVLDAESGLTKRALAEYFEAVADNMLPHVAGRPLSVVRCPDGNRKPCFFQKHVGMGTAHEVKSVTIRNRKSGAKEEFLTVDSISGLIGLAQMGVLEIHTWGARNDSVDHPDRIAFDLDPDPSIDWETLAATAQEFKRRLAKVGLKSFLKMTGGKGLHVVAPIRPEHEWPAVKQFAHELVLQLEREDPKLYITKMSLAARKNRIFLDYLRNDREATSIAPYSPRARSGAPVAMPLKWDELKSANMPKFYISDFDRWQGRLRRDPWSKLLETDQSLTVTPRADKK
jgi:bifunctional non-homologous end joining protein LigD